MSKRKRFGVSQALTRGLSETINVVENNAGVFRNAVIPLSRIELDPDNPRKLTIGLEDIRYGLDKNDPSHAKKAEELEKLKELAFTIETNGIINPIVVYKRGEVYRIVAGERRCLGSILAGKNEIDARIFNEKPKGFELKLIQWVENTAREDLTLLERVENIRDMINEYEAQQQTNVTATVLKDITGLSLPQSSYYMTVLNAPEDVRVMIENGNIRSLDKAAIIASIQSTELRQSALDECVKGCSLKDLRLFITKEKHLTNSQIKSFSKKGKTITRINLGFTNNLQVVKKLVSCVLNENLFESHESYFSKIDWNKTDQANRAFKKIIELLEKEVRESK